MYALKLLFVCISFPPTKPREVYPRLWPSTSTMTPHTMHSLISGQNYRKVGKRKLWKLKLFISFLSSSLPFSVKSTLRLMFHKLSPSAKTQNSHKMFIPHEKSLEMNWKQSLFRTHLFDEWKLIYGRWCQEIWVKYLAFRFVIWKYPAIIFFPYRIWSEFITGTMTGKICYLTKPSDP